MTETVETKEIAILDPKDVTVKNIELMLTQVEEIPETPETKEQYETVKGMHIQVKKVLPKIEARRKEIKKGPLLVCARIDASAKNAVKLVQPLLLATSYRREAWEQIAEKEKVEAQEVDKARLDVILKAFESLKLEVSACTPNVPSERIRIRIDILEKSPVTEEIFQEHLAEAENIKGNGLIAAQMALENRLEFEAQAEAQAKVEAGQKAEAVRLEKISADQKAEARKLSEEKSAFKAKAAAVENRKKEEAESARIKERDTDWSEALPVHIADHIMPVAMKMNNNFDRKRQDDMDAESRLKMDRIREENAIQIMMIAIRESMEKCFDKIELEENMRLMLNTRAGVNDLFSAFRCDPSNVLKVK